MDDQNSKIAGIVVALLTIVLGYGFVRENLQSQRPYSPLAAQNILDVEDLHRVESRLWQDPFESFQSNTNPTEEADISSNAVANDPEIRVRQLLWKDIGDRCTNGDSPIAILAVTLPGGPYGEDKEVRMRLRYAVELALLTHDVGPEDSTHIYTNSVWLNSTTSPDENLSNARLTQYAYEWFRTENSSSNRRVCVLWLNEDDFADHPASRLGSLMEKIPLTGTNHQPVSFYLIGPRSSDTLEALADTITTNLPADIDSTLTNVALTGHFFILSPEATAPVAGPNLWDPDDQDVGDKVNATFKTNVFFNWIATDEHIAGLISQELANRLDSAKPNPSNVVVLLSEQDTYYGRKLADEWMTALVTNGVCNDKSHVWQFSYLRGVDGSKTQPESPESSPSGAAPDAALETALALQQQGQRAVGDSQLDYLVRLADFLQKKDDELKDEGTGQIIAFGLTGSDTYDKMILLEAMRGRFPDAVFFTSDLDADLWTTQQKQYTRNLLVGSAYPVNPFIMTNNAQPLRQEFAPFRDVYQAAVYRACYAAIKTEETSNITNLRPHEYDLRGGLYKIGRHGPVRLADTKNGSPDYSGVTPRLPTMFLISGAVALAGITIYFVGGLGGGIFFGPKRQTQANSPAVQEARDKEFDQQIGLSSWRTALYAICFAGVLLSGWLFFYLTWKVAMIPGEEPWSFSDGISIWPSEYIMFATIVTCLCLLFLMEKSRYDHLKELWKKYFRESGTAYEGDENWDKYYRERQEEWKPAPKPEAKTEIIRKRAADLSEKGGHQYGGDEKYMDQAQAEFKQEQNATLIKAWMPPFIEVGRGETLRPEAWLDAENLFRSYLRLGRFLTRIGRTSLSAFLYSFAIAFLILPLCHSAPTRLLIRGPWSHFFDVTMTAIVVYSIIIVLFWVLDYSLVTKRVLNYFTRQMTFWPDSPRRRKAAQFGVGLHDTAAMVDVDYAAFQTEWAAPMMFWPISLQLLFIFARSPCFDNWTWHIGMVLVLAINFIVAVACWWLVRQAAFNVQKKAVNRMNQAILSVKMLPDDSSFSVIDSDTGHEVSVGKDVYLKNLKNVRKAIQEERRGAFARWFQDPSYLAVFIPSGATGIITLIATYLLKK